MTSYDLQRNFPPAVYISSVHKLSYGKLTRPPAQALDPSHLPIHLPQPSIQTPTPATCPTIYARRLSSHLRHLPRLLPRHVRSHLSSHLPSHLSSHLSRHLRSHLPQLPAQSPAQAATQAPGPNACPRYLAEAATQTPVKVSIETHA